MLNFGIQDYRGSRARAATSMWLLWSAVLVILRSIRFQAGKALARRVDNEEVAVGTVVPAQADGASDRLIVRCVYLHERGEHQEAGERIIRLKTAKEEGEVATPHRQLEFVPLLAEVKREAFTGTIAPADASFIQIAIVVGAKALEEAHGQATI